MYWLMFTLWLRNKRRQITGLLVPSLALTMTVLSTPAIVSAAGPGTVYEAKIKPTLALVRSILSDGTSYGTAFCISSTANGSYFLTNHHVVYDASVRKLSSDVTLIFADAPTKAVHAEIVRSGAQSLASEPPDLAILFVKSKTNVAYARFSSVRALDGQAIGIAGFPAFQISIWESTHELEPTVAIGSVDGLNLGDYYVQYDAKTDHGNSGGPVFDTVTGYVLGIVDVGIDGSDPSVDNFLAISDAQAQHFMAGLDEVHVAVLTPSSLQLEERFVSAHSSRRCPLAVEDFSKRFAEWNHNHVALLAKVRGSGPAASRSVAAARARESSSAAVLSDESTYFRRNTRVFPTVMAIISDVTALDKDDMTGGTASGISDDLQANVRKFDVVASCV